MEGWLLNYALYMECLKECRIPVASGGLVHNSLVALSLIALFEAWLGWCGLEGFVD